MKMTRAEYLKARGWFLNDVVGEGIDCALFIDPKTGESMGWPIAIVRQLARDAEEERSAWATFAAARLSMACDDGASRARGYTLGAYDPADAAVDADKMLAARRVAFAVEFTD